MKARTTVIIPYCKPEIFNQWKENLKKHPSGEPFELVIIDNSQTPLEDLYMSKQINDAMKKVTTEYICLTNDDVYPKTDNWMTIMIEELERYGFATINPWQLPELKEMPPLTPQTFTLVSRNSPYSQFANNACGIFRTAHAKEIGYWDENYRWWFVDRDYSYRMDKFGPHAYTFSVIAEHKPGTTANAETEPYKTWIKESKEYFERKWGEKCI